MFVECLILHQVYHRAFETSNCRSQNSLFSQISHSHNWNLFALIGYYFRELFVIDFDMPKGSIHQDDDADATVTMINPELDKTSYHEEIVITEQATATTETLQPTETLQSILKQVYANVEEVKRELELSRKQKVIATLGKVMELIPKQCKICSEIVLCNAQCLVLW